MILLAKYIKKYSFDSKSHDSLKHYLLNTINMRYDAVIKKYDKERIEKLETLNMNIEFQFCDFIVEIENKELINELKDFIVKTDYFTFLQKKYSNIKRFYK